MGLGGQSDAPAALPPGKTRYPLYRRLGGPQGLSVRVRKISLPPGFDPQTVQSLGLSTLLDVIESIGPYLYTQLFYHIFVYRFFGRLLYILFGLSVQVWYLITKIMCLALNNASR